MQPLEPNRKAKRRAAPGAARKLGLGLLSGACLLPAAAFAQDGEEVTSLGVDPALGLDPAAPQAGALPGGMTPSYGTEVDTEGSRFDFHGFMTVPLNIGLNERENRQPGESKTVLHTPPVVPGDLETFSHTGVLPAPYVKLNLSYGTKIVTGTVSVLARQTNVSTGFFDPPSQAGINDAFLGITPELPPEVKLKLLFGAFSNRYGIMGEYDEGRYDTPVMARLNGVGENAVATYSLGDVTLLLEQGILGNSDKVSAGVTPDGWNDFADPNVGTSLVNHVHAGMNYAGIVTLGAHYIAAFSQDDRASAPLSTDARLGDGSIRVLGGDLRFTLGRFGHLYAGVSHTDAEEARTVGPVIEVLNTKGGPGLMEHYLGEVGNGTGKLLTIASQYDLSVGRLVSYPVPFSGDGPDIFLSLFAMHVGVDSEDPSRDGIAKFKYGVEGTYSLLSWFAVSGRYDRVAPNVDNDRYSFAVISPRLLFRSDWQSTDQVMVQYSRYMHGSLTTVRTGYPPEEDVLAIPDADVLSISASMWW